MTINLAELKLVRVLLVRLYSDTVVKIRLGVHWTPGKAQNLITSSLNILETFLFYRDALAPSKITLTINFCVLDLSQKLIVNKQICLIAENMHRSLDGHYLTPGGLEDFRLKTTAFS